MIDNVVDKILRDRKVLAAKAPVVNSPLTLRQYADNELRLVKGLQAERLEAYCKATFPALLGIFSALTSEKARRGFLSFAVTANRAVCMTGYETDWESLVNDTDENAGMKAERNDVSDADQQRRESFRRVAEPVLKVFSKRPVKIDDAVRALIKAFSQHPDEVVRYDWSEPTIVRGRVKGVISRVEDSGSDLHGAYEITRNGDEIMIVKKESD